MKVEALDDPSGQIGFYTKQRSIIIAQMDAEIQEAIKLIEEKYKQQLEDNAQIIESTRSLLS